MIKNGKFYFERILEYAHNDFLHCFRKPDCILLLYRLFSLLSVCFSIREKFKGKEETDERFRGLKRFYNIIKHNYPMNEIINDMILPDECSTNDPVFMPIKSLSYKHSGNKNREDEYYENYVQGKSIKDLMDELYTKTKELFSREEL